MIQLVHVLLFLPLQVMAASPTATGPVLVYRTEDPMTSAVAYDTEGDSAAELVQLGSYGPSVLRRVSRSGEPGAVIWRTEGETLCPGLSCGVGLEFAEKLKSFIVAVAAGTSRYQTARVYLAPLEGRPHLLARVVAQPTRDYPDEDELEPGVVGFRRIESAIPAADSEQILVNGLSPGDGSEIKTFALELGRSKPLEQLQGRVLGRTSEGLLVTPNTKGWKRLGEGPEEQPLSAPLSRARLIPVTAGDLQSIVQVGERQARLRKSGELVIYKATQQAFPADSQSAEAGAAKPIEFRACGADNPKVMGVWATKRGTFMVAVDCVVNKEQNGRLVYGGRAHCLYEIQ